jgi:outer membrane protein assembly factor BamB
MAIFVVTGTRSAFAEVTGGADNLRTGWYSDEPSLTPALLSGSGFQQVFKDSLQGQIYAQPLTADGVLLVATEENWVYGLDPYTGAVRWKEQFGVPVDASEEPGAPVKCTDLTPHVGITGTPVIDTEHNIAYFVSTRYTKVGTEPESGWYMHAVELTSGKEVANFPVKIEGEAQNIPGLQFEPFQELQRPALLMMNGVVYAGFGSHCDHEPYEGWIVGVSTSGLLTTKWATSAHGGSIWQAGGGLVSDGSGQILFSTGNDNTNAGEWDPPVGPGNAAPEGKLGESVVRAEVQPKGELKATDFFSPFNNKILDEGDIDLGSSAPIALPSQYFGTPSVPNLLVQDGKAGYVYLLNRDNLGGMGQGPGGTDKVVQELGPYGGVWDSAAVWPGDGGYVYIPSVAPHSESGGSSDKLRFFKYEVEAGAPKLSLAATSPETFAFGSGSPIVTSNGTTNGTGVMWITRCPEYSCEGAKLVAYNPVPLGKEALQVLWQAPIGTGNKFSRPDASNGHIYVGNRKGAIYGFSGPQLTSSSPSLELAAPVGSQATREVTLTSTGTELEVTGVKQPSVPFEANLPAVHTKIAPGEAIKVTVRFNPASRGPANGEFGIVTQAGETKVALSGSGEESSQERAEREQHEREAKEKAERETKEKEKAERETKEKAGPTTTGGIVTTASLITPPAGPAVTAESSPTLTKLKLHSVASRLSSHRRKVVVSYALSAAGTVEVAIFRRVISHRCQRGVSTCVRWMPTKIKLRVTGHAGANVLTLNLARLAAGRYRLAAMPIARSGASGITQYVRFTAVR